MIGILDAAALSILFLVLAVLGFEAARLADDPLGDSLAAMRLRNLLGLAILLGLAYFVFKVALA